MKPNEICRKRLIHTLHLLRQCGESMSEIPAELFYTKEHEWIRMDGDIATIGITDHAQDALTDIVYIELLKVEKCWKIWVSLQLSNR